MGTSLGQPLDNLDFLVELLRRLTAEAALRGTRIALEPMPFSVVGSVPAAADLMRKVDRTGCGLVVDYWHVFRAGTTLDELSASLEASQIFGVELNDAAGEIRGTLFEDTRDNRRSCGQGDQDVTGFIQALKSIGFNGTILWLRAPAQNRRLFEKAEFYEAWATEDRTGFHYEVTKGLTQRNGQTPANEDPSSTGSAAM